MEKKSYLYVIFAGVLWGIIGIFFRELSALGFTSMQIVAIRVIVSAVVMTVYLYFHDKSLLKINLKDSGLFVGTGILSLLLFNWCYFKTMEVSTIPIAAVLLYTSPIFVLLLSAVLFKEKLTNVKIAAVVLTFVGCILVTGVLHGTKSALPVVGILTGLGSGFWYAMYSIFGRFALKKYDALTVSAYTFIFAAVAALPLARLHTQAMLLMRPNVILLGIGIGVLCCMLPFIFYTKGLSGMETGKAAIMATIEPVVATFVGVVLYKEKLTIYAVCGMMVIFLAIVLVNKKSKCTSAAHEALEQDNAPLSS